jgi:hypothetical protein
VANAKLDTSIDEAKQAGIMRASFGIRNEELHDYIIQPKGDQSANLNWAINSTPIETSQDRKLSWDVSIYLI